MSKTRRLSHWLCVSGSVGVVFYVLHMMVGAAHYPGYDWRSQAVSDLTAVNAPSFAIAVGLAAAANLFSSLCAALMATLVPRKAKAHLRWGVYCFAVMTWISAVGYAVFPLSTSGFSGTTQDVIHVYMITPIVVLSSIAALTLIIWGAWHGRSVYRGLAFWALGALLIMLVGPVGMAIASEAWFGLFERFSVFSVVVFNAVLGLHGFFLWQHGFPGK